MDTRKGGRRGDLLSNAVTIDPSEVTPPSPRQVVFKPRAQKALPETPNPPFHHHVGYAADYIFYSYVNLN